jgi:hypothetical protein
MLRHGNKTEMWTRLSLWGPFYRRRRDVKALSAFSDASALIYSQMGEEHRSKNGAGLEIEGLLFPFFFSPPAAVQTTCWPPTQLAMNVESKRSLVLSLLSALYIILRCCSWENLSSLAFSQSLTTIIHTHTHTHVLCVSLFFHYTAFLINVYISLFDWVDSGGWQLPYSYRSRSLCCV